MRLSMGLPDREEELEVIRRFVNSQESPLVRIHPEVTAQDLISVRATASEVCVPDDVAGYLADLVMETRRRQDLIMGVSPRGSIAALRAAQVLAIMDGRDYIVPEDIKAVAIPVFAHRIKSRIGYSTTQSNERMIEEILNTVAAPTEEFGQSVRHDGSRYIKTQQPGDIGAV